MSRRLLVVIALVLVAILAAIGGAVYRASHRSAAPVVVTPQGVPSPAPAADATSQDRIKVQVLNATTTRGLGRRATQFLRDRGFDVVETGNAPKVQDSTVVIDRSNHPEWAKRIADAMGGVRVESHPDSSRYLDATVVLGSRWRPPTKPFYP